MFSEIYGRFSWRSRRARLLTAVVLCAAGLGIGFGGNTLVAQLDSGNPTPQAETSKYCEYVITQPGFILDPTCGNNCGYAVGWQLCYGCQSPCPWQTGMTINIGCCYYPVNLVNTDCVNCQ